VFGGTFDPLHVGHLAIADQVLQRTAYEALWFVVTNVPPLRDPAAAPADARLQMVRAATAGHAGFSVVETEVHRGGVSYTADTMDRLHDEHPAVEFALLLGADVARSIPRWHRAADLLDRERFVIVNRTGHATLDDAELTRLGYALSRVTRLEVESPDISGSEIRRLVAAGEDISAMVPAAVADIIHRRGLYRAGAPVHNASG